MIGPMMDVDLNDEGGRFAARHAICAVLEPWFERHTLEEITTIFTGSGVLWGPYQNFGQLVHEDWRCSTANPMFGTVEQPGVGEILANAVPLDFRHTGRKPAAPAPRLGQHTEEVLTSVLGLSSLQFAQLVDAGVAA